MLHGLSQLGTASNPLFKQLIYRSAATAAAASDHCRLLTVLKTQTTGEQFGDMHLLRNSSKCPTQALTVQRNAGIVALQLRFGLLQSISHGITPKATDWHQDVQNHSSAVVVAAAAAGIGPTEDADSTDKFVDDYVNYVYLMGRVVKGPKLIYFQASNKCKAIMVLGLFNRVTGDVFVDAPRPVLVEAWGPLAQQIHQQIQPDSIISVIGHLALDVRPRAGSGLHGPALTLKADEWRWIAPDSIPADRHTFEYQGEFDRVFNSQGARSAAPDAAAAAADGQPQQERRRRRTQADLPVAWVPQAVELFLKGQQPDQIATEVGVSARTVTDNLITAALAEGLNSSMWPALLRHLGLTAEGGVNPATLFDAVEAAIQNNTAPLTKDGQVRLKAIREYVLENCGDLSEVMRQQEANAGGDLSITYYQLKVMVGIRKKGGHPSLLRQ